MSIVKWAISALVTLIIMTSALIMVLAEEIWDLAEFVVELPFVVYAMARRTHRQMWGDE